MAFYGLLWPCFVFYVTFIAFSCGHSSKFIWSFLCLIFLHGKDDDDNSTFVCFSVMLVLATWKRKGWLLKTWMAITCICTFSDLRSVLFDLMVGSVDVGLAFALVSLLANIVCLITVFYFERHLAEEKARLYQQTWITTDDSRKNAGFESDVEDLEEADEVQV